MDHVNNNFSLDHFTNESTQNFDEFIALIRGETEDPIDKLCTNYFECEHINGESSAILSGFAHENLEKIGVEGVNDNISEENGEDLSETTTSLPLKSKGGKVDRTNTLISERRRRETMKEKLYALRSLVPNITKMDKASIIGDAASYVEDLQNQIQNLKTEIVALESYLITGVQNIQQHGSNSNSVQLTNIPLLQTKIVLEMGLYPVEERGYYVRLVCNRGAGVAASLYKAIHSFTNFTVHSSNLSITTCQNFLFTFTFNVGEYSEVGMNLPNLKLWIVGALLNQGFDFTPSP